MVHDVLVVGMLQVNCSICADEQSGDAFVIDPGDEADRILETVRERSWTVKRVVLTHAHLDHIGGVAEVVAATGAPVSLHPADRKLAENAQAQASMLGMRTPPAFSIDEDLADGDVLDLAGTEIRILHTPGHSQGGCCLWIPSENRLLCGDTLFRDSVGRTDLPGGNGRQLIESIQTKLMTLPEETVVTPGHGPETTIGRERRFNPFLQAV